MNVARKKGPEGVYFILGLVAITLGVFWNVQYHDFAGFDDQLFLVNNPRVQGGLSLDNVIWAFTTTYPDYWHPVPWLSHMMDFDLYGLNPGGHHWNNLIFHIANTILLFLTLRRMTHDQGKSAFAALLFAVHPLHVESVAWITARKDVLSTFFCFLALWAYTHYVERSNPTRYILVLVIFALGLMSKPMLITLPFVFILLDYWPFGRFGAGEGPYPSKDPFLSIRRSAGQPVSKLILEKVPMIIMIALAVIMTLSSKPGTVAYVSAGQRPVSLRILNAVASYATYILKMLWPDDLAVFYPYPNEVPVVYFVVAAAGLIALTVLIYIKRRKFPYLAVGWSWYIGTLLPVLGLIQWGEWPARADRFTYIPLTGLFIMISWGIPAIRAPRRFRRYSLKTAAAAVIIILGIVSRQQVEHWQDSRTLFQHAVNVTENNHLALNNLGRAILSQKGKPDEAMACFKEALRINPHSVYSYNNLGAAWARKGDLGEAVTYFSKAVQLVPDFEEAHFNLGLALTQMGRLDEAKSHFTAAIGIRPDYGEAHYRLGAILAHQGKAQEALGHYFETLRINPDHPQAHNEAGVILSTEGDFERAIRHFKEALRIQPGYQKARYNLGVALKKAGVKQTR